jgi:hypothetical protein
LHDWAIPFVTWGGWVVLLACGLLFGEFRVLGGPIDVLLDKFRLSVGHLGLPPQALHVLVGLVGV